MKITKNEKGYPAFIDNCLSARRKRERGTSTVEYVVIVGFALLLSASLADFGNHLGVTIDQRLSQALGDGSEVPRYRESSPDGGGTDHTGSVPPPRNTHPQGEARPGE